MGLIDSIFNHISHIEFPQGFIGYLVWLLYFGATIYLVYKGIGFHPSRPKIPFIWSGVLVVGVVLTSAYIGFNLKFGLDLPIPSLPLQANGGAWMVFSSIPWMLAAFTFGPLPSVFLALISGLIIGVWNDYSLFTPVIYALLASVYSQLVNLRYRSTANSWFRKPFGAAVVIALIYPIIKFLGDIFTHNASIATRFEFAYEYLLEHTLAYGLTVTLAGVVIWLVLKRWKHLSIIKVGGNSQMNMTLAGRMLTLWGPLMVVLLFSIISSLWFYGEAAVIDQTSQQMEISSMTISEQIPGFFHMGQNLISSAAKSNTLINSNDFQLMNGELENLIEELSFFNQFFVLSSDGVPITGFPEQDFNSFDHDAKELEGFALASQGIGFQVYPSTSRDIAKVSDFVFIKPIKTDADQVTRILVGRADTNNNIYSEPWLKELQLYSEMEGFATLLDADNKAFYHSDISSMGSEIEFYSNSEEQIFKGVGFDGSKQLILESAVEGTAYKLLIAVPTAELMHGVIQQINSISGVLVLLMIAGYAFLYSNMRIVNNQVENLVATVSMISDVNLDQEVDVRGFGEVGHLAEAFEKMRKSIREYLDDYQSKLSVSRKVGSSLDLEKAMQPILERILQFGAVSGRLAIQPGVLPVQLKATRDGVSYGELASLYSVLDRQVLAMTKHQQRVFLTSPSRAKLQMPEGQELPGSIAAIALEKDGEFLGSLWVAYEMPHQFDDAEMRMLTWIADYAAQALINYRSFVYERLWGDWMETVFDGWESPVLFVDANQNIMYANRASGERLNSGGAVIPEMKLQDMKIYDKISEIFTTSLSENQINQIDIPDFGNFVVHSYPLSAEIDAGGTAYVFQDVTEYLSQASQRLDLISVVSQYFRTPLTLMQGYTSMMDVFGPLNEQQVSYLEKIKKSIEQLNTTVEDILDFNRVASADGLRISSFDAVKLVEDVTSNLQFLADHRQIDLEFILPPQSKINLNADKALVQQALNNLIDNSIKFNRANGKVIVVVSDEGNQIKFSIKDNGIGISEVDLQQLFDRGKQQNKSGLASHRGSGLGLSMVKAIMDWHDGKVHVTSVLGEGSEFSLIFPKK